MYIANNRFKDGLPKNCEYGPPTNGLGMYTLIAQARSEHPDTLVGFDDGGSCLAARAGWPGLAASILRRCLGYRNFDILLDAERVGDFLAASRDIAGTDEL